MTFDELLVELVRLGERNDYAVSKAALDSHGKSNIGWAISRMQRLGYVELSDDKSIMKITKLGIERFNIIPSQRKKIRAPRRGKVKPTVI